MDKRKTSAKIGMIICFVVGLCLIFTGIFIPRAMIKNRYEYLEDIRHNETYYEFEIDTKHKLDVKSGTVNVKVAGTKTETFEIFFDKSESDVEEGEYVFFTFLTGSDSHLFNELEEIEIKNDEGKMLTFEPEKFDSAATILPMTIFPIFFGVVFMIFGLMIFIGKSAKIHMAHQTFETVSDMVSKAELLRVDEQKKTITCSYCGLENDADNAKCEHCGGPLYRK